MWSTKSLIVGGVLAAPLNLVESTSKGTVILEGASTGLIGEIIEAEEDMEGRAGILFSCVNRIGSDSDLDLNGHCGIGSEAEET